MGQNGVFGGFAGKNRATLGQNGHLTDNQFPLFW